MFINTLYSYAPKYPSRPWLKHANTTFRKKITFDKVVKVADSIFQTNTEPPGLPWSFPEQDGRLADTRQLVSCLSLLQLWSIGDLTLSSLNTDVRAWLKKTEDSEVEKARLKELAWELIRAYEGESCKVNVYVNEVVCLVPVLDDRGFRHLLSMFVDKDYNGKLIHNPDVLAGLGQLIRNAPSDFLRPSHLIPILEMVYRQLQGAHDQESEKQGQLFDLTVSLSIVLDAMVTRKVTDVDRVGLHEPLLKFLQELRRHNDYHLKYYAAYAFQALLRIPDDELPWQRTARQAATVIKGVSGMVSAVKGIDLEGFLTSLKVIHEGFEGVLNVVEVLKSMSYVFEGEQELMDEKGLTEIFKVNRRRSWYTALQGADKLIERGDLAALKELICGAPCRLDLAFQWGVCQRLGNIAANTLWDNNVRLDAVKFLEEIYGHDADWGGRRPIKAYILDILMHLKLQVPCLPGTKALVNGLRACVLCSRFILLY